MRSPGMQPSTNGRPQSVYRSGKSGLGTSRIRLWLWRARRRLAQSSDRLASLPPQRSSDRFRDNEAHRRTRQELLAASPEQLTHPRTRAQESRSQRRNHSSHGRARRQTSARRPRLFRRVRSPLPAKSTLRNSPSDQRTSTTVRSSHPLRAYQPRTFALRLGAPSAKLDAIQSQPVTLHYDLAVASNDDTKTEGGGFDGKGKAMPAEMLPATDQLSRCPVRSSARQDRRRPTQSLLEGRRSNCLPATTTASIFWLHRYRWRPDRSISELATKLVNLNIQDWSGFIGQWDTRIWKSPAGTRLGNLGKSRRLAACRTCRSESSAPVTSLS